MRDQKSKPRIRHEPATSGIEEPACKENTQGPRQPLISKRIWDEGEVSPTAQSLQKKARTSTRAQAELPAAQNTGGSLQEHQTPNLGSPITSLSTFQRYDSDPGIGTVQSGQDLHIIDGKKGLDLLKISSGSIYYKAILTEATNCWCLSFYPNKNMRKAFEDLGKNVAQGMFNLWKYSTRAD
jgi:hypothetical protein